MRRLLLLLLVPALFLTAPTFGLSATLVRVPGGTQVPVKVVEPISSSSANVGDVFQIKAAEDVVVDGWIVIPKDAGGQGEVVSVDRAGKHGHPGKLGLKIDYIHSADGGRIRLSTVNHTSVGEAKKGASSTATIATSILLGPIGLFAHNFVKGRDVTVDSSRTILVFVDSTVHVRAKQKGFDD